MSTKLSVGLRSSSKLMVPELYIFNDSKLVVNQVTITGKFKTQGDKMAYLAIAKTLITEFRAFKIKKVGRDINSHVDALVGLASVFEGKIGQTIAVDLISIMSHETHQDSILGNTKL